jgi:type II secretory pathway pseudopilin PulG
MTKSRSGFTVIEVLLAAGIMAGLLGVLGAVFLTSTRGYRTTSEVSDLQQRAEVATRLLTYELSLAGYRGVQLGYESVSIPDPRLTIFLASEGESDAVRVVYNEDRYVGGRVLRAVRYFVNGLPGTGEESLYREVAEDGGSAVASPALVGVRWLKALQFRLEDGSTSAITENTTLAPAGAVAILFRVTLTNGYDSDFWLGFHNLDLGNPAQVRLCRAPC